MKFNTQKCKEALVDFIKKNPQKVLDLWDEEDQKNINIEEIQSVKVWIRSSKEKREDGTIERFFRAEKSKQIDVADQLTAFIITDHLDQKILQIEVDG